MAPSRSYLIRHADPERDAAGCAAAYAPAVLEGVSSLEEIAPDAPEMRRRMEGLLPTHPWLVAEQAGAAQPIAGYAYASPHHPRSSYRWTANVSVYIAPGHQRCGLGRALYAELLELLVRQGLYEACAGITLPNDGSVGLHESFGFAPVGVYRNVGYKHGAWRSVGWWQRPLQPRPAGPPPEPGPPARLSGPVPVRPAATT